MTDEDEFQPDDLADQESSELATEASVICPYCGETVSIAIDPNGGRVQEYIEDCEVCCRPWLIQVSYDEEGIPEVSVTEAE